MPADFHAEFWSSDRRFGVRITAAAARELLSISEASKGIETGGILLGRYVRGHRLAVVLKATASPEDSRGTWNRFVRGVVGLQNIIRTWWNRGQGFYLGEWHYHTAACDRCSDVDLDQMSEIALDPAYACPEPILIIVTLDGHSLRTAVSVFPNGRRLPLFECQQHRGEG